MKYTKPHNHEEVKDALCAKGVAKLGHSLLPKDPLEMML